MPGLVFCMERPLQALKLSRNLLLMLQAVNAHKVIHKSYRWIIPFLFLTVSHISP